jgi:hypothetical protein
MVRWMIVRHALGAKRRVTDLECGRLVIGFDQTVDVRDRAAIPLRKPSGGG